METVHVDGLEVAYRRAGEGPPLVLVHGAAGDGRYWRGQLDSLSDAFTVVAWDEPGAGASSDLPTGFGLAEYADALAAVIAHLGLGPAHVAGLSWGGTVALELYRRHPERVASLVLVDTYAGWEGSLPAEEVAARLQGVREMLTAAPEDFDPTFPGLFARDPEPDVAALLAETGADLRPASLEHQLELMAQADLNDVLPTITVPTLLLWGEHDARSPLDVARAFERAIPRAQLHVIPGAGHMSNLEAPYEFDAAIRRFCGGPRPVVRPADTGDMPTVGRLLDAFNREYDDVTPGPAALADRLRDLVAGGDTEVLLVGEPEAVGLAVLRFRPSIWSTADECYLAELYVRPGHRGGGLGRALLVAAIEAARARGADHMDLGTSEDDVAARALYASLGFTNREGAPDGPVMYVYERPL